MNQALLFLIPLLPLCCAVLNMLFGMRLPRLVTETLAVAGVAAAFLLTLLFWATPTVRGRGRCSAPGSPSTAWRSPSPCTSILSPRR